MEQCGFAIHAFFNNRIGCIKESILPKYVGRTPFFFIWPIVLLGGVYGKEKRQTYKQNNKKIK